MGMSVATVKAAWLAISAPWSQVMERQSSFGRVLTAVRIATSTASAERWLSRWRRSRNRLVRSTSVPTAVRPAFAQDDVALPVARNGTIVCFGGPLGDHDHPRQAPALLRPALGTAGGASGTQTAGELSAQLAAALDEERLVDRLVAHPHLRVVGVIQS